MIYDFQELANAFAEIPCDFPQKAANMIKTHPRIFAYGAGRSGLMIKAFAMRLAQAGYTVYAVGDVTTPAIDKGDLLILASASGETSSVIRCAETARAVGADILVLTASAHATLGANADERVIFSAPTKNEQGSGAVMGTVFEQAVLLFCDKIVEALGADASNMRARHANLE